MSRPTVTSMSGGDTNFYLPLNVSTMAAVSSSGEGLQLRNHPVETIYFDQMAQNRKVVLSPNNLPNASSHIHYSHSSHNLLLTASTPCLTTPLPHNSSMPSVLSLSDCSSPQPSFSQFSSPSLSSRAGDVPTPVGVGQGLGFGDVGGVSRRCEVCKEHASGNHYGCWTCEGCKAFFKRSVQAQSQYTCVSGNQCDVEGAGRKNCPACRLRRCYEAGMTAESIKKGDRKLGVAASQDAASVYRQENPVAASLLHRLIEIEIEPISADFSLPEAGDENLSANSYLIKLFARLADRLLSFYVEWAKSIPGYSNLSLSTQRSLLSRCFFVEALLDILYRSIELDDGNIQISADIAMTQNALMSLSDGKRFEAHDELVEASKLFKNLRISFEEYLALKCVVLVSSEDLIDVAADLTYVKILQDRAIDCLNFAVHETLYKIDINSPEETMQRRTSKLLILISRLNRLSFQILTHITHIKESIPMFELVGSLLNQNMKS